jgi:hypothetical protein
LNPRLLGCEHDFGGHERTAANHCGRSERRLEQRRTGTVDGHRAIDAR